MGATGLLPFQTVDNIILVDAVLNRKAHVTLLLDTGAMQTILTPNTVKRLCLSPPADAPKRAVRVADGQLQGVPLVQLSALAIGEAMVANLEVGVSVLSPRAPLVGGEPAAAQAWRDLVSVFFPRVLSVDGLLGGDFLTQFKMTLDRTTRQLWLEPHQPVRP